jgi:hypothetical protein
MPVSPRITASATEGRKQSECAKSRAPYGQAAWRRLAIPLCTFLLLPFPIAGEPAEAPKVFFPFKDGDRVAWIGSSSTAIGVWPKTMEFLLRTRHPDVKLEFKRFTTGGGTFATGTQKLDEWLGDFKPTVVLFNYGSNDVSAGAKGLPKSRKRREVCGESKGQRESADTHDASSRRCP